jgi:ACS family D-galactonate transporter-like MFS transporter
MLRSSIQRYGVLGLLCTSAALAYLMRNSIGAAESTIRADLGLTKEQSGALISAFFWPYALCQLPAAALAQRIGNVRALAIFGLVWSSACAAFSIGDYATMVAARVVMGIGQAGLVPAAMGMMSVWFPRSMQGGASGSFAAAMSVGSIVAAPLTGMLSIESGWRSMFLWYAAPGVVWAIWFSMRVRDRPELGLQDESDAEPKGVRTMPFGAGEAELGWGRLLFCSPVMLLCCQQVCRAAGYIFFASWFNTYLQEARGLTVVRSGFLTVMPLLGDVGGSFLGGVISDSLLRRTGSARLARQVFSAVAMLGCATLVGSSRWVERSESAVVLISLGMFCAAVGNPCANVVAMGLGGRHVAVLSGLNNMCGNLGAASFPMVVPMLLRGDGSWDTVLNVFVGLYLVAAAAWFAMGNLAGLQSRDEG